MCMQNYVFFQCCSLENKKVHQGKEPTIQIYIQNCIYGPNFTDVASKNKEGQ